MKIGVFGGSFDPPHLSHVAICTFALGLTDIDEILVVPCFEHALSKRLTAFEHRLAMCELAFGDLRRTTVSPIEQELGGISYTLRTLEQLRAQRPEAELVLIVGADALHDRASWHRFDRIEELAEIVGFGRAGIPAIHGATLPAPPAVSATEIRQALRRGLDVAGLVPASVLGYIAEHELYQDL